MACDSMSSTKTTLKFTKFSENVASADSSVAVLVDHARRSSLIFLTKGRKSVVRLRTSGPAAARRASQLPTTSSLISL